MTFQPDYRNIALAAANRRPPRLPFYEHLINVDSMENILDKPFEIHNGFFLTHEYDTVSYEFCVTTILPGGGALLGERSGPIQTRTDFEAYPWDELPDIFWSRAEREFKALIEIMPADYATVGDPTNLI